MHGAEWIKEFFDFAKAAKEIAELGWWNIPFIALLLAILLRIMTKEEEADTSRSAELFKGISGGLLLWRSVALVHGSELPWGWLGYVLLFLFGGILLVILIVLLSHLIEAVGHPRLLLLVVVTMAVLFAC